MPHRRRYCHNEHSGSEVIINAPWQGNLVGAPSYVNVTSLNMSMTVYVGNRAASRLQLQVR